MTDKTPDLEVEARLKGFYGGRVRKPGERFVLADEKDFSKRWMKPRGAKAEKLAKGDDDDKKAASSK